MPVNRRFEKLLFVILFSISIRFGSFVSSHICWYSIRHSFDFVRFRNTIIGIFSNSFSVIYFRNSFICSPFDEQDHLVTQIMIMMMGSFLFIFLKWWEFVGWFCENCFICFNIFGNTAVIHYVELSSSLFHRLISEIIIIVNLFNFGCYVRASWKKITCNYNSYFWSCSP